MKKTKKLFSTIMVAVMSMITLFSGCGGGNVPKGYVEEGTVDNGALFGEEEGMNYYNYCPSMFYEDENTLHVYYCSNKISGNITDYICYRKGIKVKGKWYWSEKSYVLAPTENTWDARHTCDPAVIKGEFAYNGETYNYLMAYLGCITNNNMRNETGIAVAKKPEGPFIKVAEANPIAKVPDDLTTWGYGQPSLVSVDKKGEVLLFYTAGEHDGTREKVERWDLSNLNAPKMEYRKEVTRRGIYQLNSSMSGIISNADFAYDPKNNEFYMISDTHPWDTTHKPSNLPSASRVAKLVDVDNGSKVGDCFISGEGKWQYKFQIDSQISGYMRNHNCCFVRDEYGHLQSNEKIEIAYTISELDHLPLCEWTYRLRRYVAEIQ